MRVINEQPQWPDSGQGGLERRQKAALTIPDGLLKDSAYQEKLWPRQNECWAKSNL